MGAIKPVHGVPWGEGVVANCRWAGACLKHVLRHLRFIPEDTADLHACFASYATICQDDEYYGASIPLARVLQSDPGVILAYKVFIRTCHFAKSRADSTMT